MKKHLNLFYIMLVFYIIILSYIILLKQIDPSMLKTVSNNEFPFNKILYVYKHASYNLVIIKTDILNSIETMQIMAIISVIIYVFISYLFTESGNKDIRNFKYAKSGSFGTARFMDGNEIMNIFKKNKKGYSIGKYKNTKIILPIGMIANNITSNSNTLVNAPTGAGKTTNFSIPTIETATNFDELKEENSIICVDPKGDMCKYTKKRVEEKGYTTGVLNFVNFENSDGIQFFKHVNNSIDVDLFTNTLIINTEGDAEVTTNSFWIKAEINYIKAIVAYVGLELKGTFKDFYAIGLDGNSKEVFDKMMLLQKDHPARMAYTIYSKADEDKRISIQFSFAIRFSLLQNKNITDVLEHDDIDLELPATKKCVYYIIVSDQESTFDFLTGLYFTLQINILIKHADKQPNLRCEKNILFLLEEFPNIGVIPDFLRKLSTVRSRAINFIIIFQDILRLQAKYPNNDWGTIIGNCDIKLLYGCSDLHTAKYFSELLGTATILVKNKNMKSTMFGSNETGDQTESEIGRNLLLPEELIKLKNECLIMLRGKNPIISSTNPYYKNKKLLKKFKIYHPQSHIPLWQQKNNTIEDVIEEDVIEEDIIEENIIEEKEINNNTKVKRKKLI